MINSLLDTDLYKLTMMQAVLHNAPAANVEYRFVNRQKEIDLRPYKTEIEKQIDHLCSLHFTKQELSYLKNLRFFKSEFLEFLRIFQLNRDFIEVSEGEDNLEITIKGPWLHTIMFEVPLLAIVSEVYTSSNYPDEDFTSAREKLATKIATITESDLGVRYKFSDFGTRRRFSYRWQREVVDTLRQALPNNFVGTSNIALAKSFGIKPIGTMAHEYFQAYQALGGRLADSQKAALQSWANEYRGDLGIALSDIYGLDAFLRDFDLYFCKLFDGVRHDSGDPFVWGDKVLAHYEAMRVDAHTKTLVFSDSLTIPKTIELFNYFNERANLGFGIGTRLTNDVGHPPLSIVIKMTRCNGQPVAKISDEPGKVICDDPSFLAYLRHVFNLPKPEEVGS
jgi:nicotinate phosphoribosyltransferase